MAYAEEASFPNPAKHTHTYKKNSKHSGVTGNFEVEHEGTKVRYCRWSQALRYMHGFRSRALEQRELRIEQSLLAYTIQMEEIVRVKAIEANRGKSEVPCGFALNQSVIKFFHFWQQKENMLKKDGRNKFQPHNHMAGNSYPNSQQAPQAELFCN